MQLDGSCHCKSVRFSLESDTPYPYQRCYCSICRKSAGSGGFAINIMGKADSLKVAGEEHIGIYQAKLSDGTTSAMERRFCKKCGSALWVYHSKWPKLIHPFASAIDTALPMPKNNTHIMLDFKAEWVHVNQSPDDLYFDGYPEKSIEAWHDELSNKPKTTEKP